jgi:pilus assembly protein CpaC
VTRMPNRARILPAVLLLALPVLLAGADPVVRTQEAPAAKPPHSGIDGKLTATVGKSLIIDSPLRIEKISVANGDLVEAVAINPQEVLINGKQPGETTLIVWQQGGSRLVYDLLVRVSPLKLEAVRQQIARDFPNDDINVTFDNDTAFVRGTVKDLSSVGRVMEIASTLGKAVNLLRVTVPATGPEVLVKVKFVSVDRSAQQSLGANIVSSAFNQITGLTPSQNGDAGIDLNGSVGSLSTAVQVLLFRRDLNIGAAIQAFQSKGLVELLAEPNLLTADGQEASFVSGGEVPIPVLQAGAAAGAVTIMYREYGIRLKFLPIITPRGTIRMRVAPEYSQLDYQHAVTIQGFTVPGLTTRKTEATVELEGGESFVIAGLVDNSASENIQKIPGLSSIPILGKLFQSRQWQKNNAELLVVVTPELVHPIKSGEKVPDLHGPIPFLPPVNAEHPINPIPDRSAAPAPSAPEPMMYEQMIEEMKREQAPSVGPMVPPSMMVPSSAQPAAAPVQNQPAQPAAQTPAAAPAAAGNGK